MEQTIGEQKVILPTAWAFLFSDGIGMSIFCYDLKIKHDILKGEYDEKSWHYNGK